MYTSRSLAPALSLALAAVSWAIVAACAGAGSTGPTGEPSLVGDPPLTGVWQAVDSDGGQFCGVDVTCDFRLELHGTAIVGSFVETVLSSNHESTVPLKGTYTPPAVHLQWGVDTAGSTFDGNLRADTLLTGSTTQPAMSVTLHRIG
ncbi:MAG: hypothetical protein KGL38_09935 [Gemmatimonadota bacterium]|nr:hypothetical protein [Gemmatimonadota bacterium]